MMFGRYDDDDDDDDDDDWLHSLQSSEESKSMWYSKVLEWNKFFVFMTWTHLTSKVLHSSRYTAASTLRCASSADRTSTSSH